MEQTEQVSEQGLFDIHIDNQTIVYLGETAKWCRFLSIVGFIFCGLFVIVAIFAGTFLASAFDSIQTAGPSGLFSGAFVSIFYILIGLLYFFPCLYLFKFSNNMRVALRNNDQESLNTSFQNLKSCFKFLGILTIVILSIYILVIVFAIVAAATYS